MVELTPPLRYRGEMLSPRVVLCLSLASLGCAEEAATLPGARLGGERMRLGPPPVLVFDRGRGPVVRLPAETTEGWRLSACARGACLALETTVDLTAAGAVVRGVGAPMLPGPTTIRLERAGRLIQRWPARWGRGPDEVPVVLAAAALRGAGRAAESVAMVDAALPTLSPEDRAWALVERARGLQHQGHPEAAPAWEAAADAAGALGWTGERGRRLRAAAYVRLWRRELSASRALLVTAEALAAELDDPLAAARVAFYRGHLEREAGRLLSAERALREALALARAHGGAAEARHPAAALSVVLQDVGRHAEALDLLATAVVDAVGPREEAVARVNRSWARAQAMRVGAVAPDWPAVEAELTAAAALFEAAAHPPGLQTVRTNRAWVRAAQGDLEGARAALAEAPAPGSFEALFRAALEAQIELGAGAPARALERFEALEVAARADAGGPAGDLIWRAVLGQARALAALGRAEADDRFAAAAAALYRSSLEAAPRSGRAGFLSDRAELERARIAHLMARGAAEAAFAVAAAGAAPVGRQLLGRVRLDRLPPQTRAEGEARRAAWLKAHDAYLAGGDAAELLPASERAAWARARAEALAEVDGALDALLAWQARALGEEVPLEAAALTAALGPGELLLLFVQSTTGGWVFAARAGSLEAHPLDPATPLAGVPALLSGVNHVYVVPGAVAGLDGIGGLDRGGRPLATTISSSWLPTPSLALRPRPGPIEVVTVIADPTTDLPEARAEGQAVAARLGVAPVLGAAATRARTLAALSAGGVLHYAGHGVLDAADPWGVRLRLHDGPITVTDLFAAPVRPRLLVLSGCDTGAAARLSARERLSLADAFALAGAGSVLATTRPVDDGAARRFVERFYAAGGAAQPGEALRRASADAWAAGDDVWQAFRLVGRP